MNCSEEEMMRHSMEIKVSQSKGANFARQSALHQKAGTSQATCHNPILNLCFLSESNPVLDNMFVEENSEKTSFGRHQNNRKIGI